jgi:hypothetical protein
MGGAGDIGILSKTLQVVLPRTLTRWGPTYQDTNIRSDLTVLGQLKSTCAHSSKLSPCTLWGQLIKNLNIINAHHH